MRTRSGQGGSGLFQFWRNEYEDAPSTLSVDRSGQSIREYKDAERVRQTDRNSEEHFATRQTDRVRERRRQR